MKTKRTSEDWSKQIDDYKKSGLSIMKYCSENHIAPSKFCYSLKIRSVKSFNRLYIFKIDSGYIKESTQGHIIPLQKFKLILIPDVLKYTTGIFRFNFKNSLLAFTNISNHL